MFEYHALLHENYSRNVFPCSRTKTWEAIEATQAASGQTQYILNSSQCDCQDDGAQSEGWAAVVLETERSTIFNMLVIGSTHGISICLKMPRAWMLLKSKPAAITIMRDVAGVFSTSRVENVVAIITTSMPCMMASE
eukprot:2663521-Amphidinium_carterae.1